MRIKFLSIIASFFMVSFVITSCLNDDNEVEYSPDATIREFTLDTIYGIKYKFTIDQLAGEIYNEDSLPVHADTIIDRILIKKLTTASGIVTMKDKKDQDSIINIADSIDLRPYVNPASASGKHLELKVWAPDMLTSKNYKFSVRLHLQDPDSLHWANKKGVEPTAFKTGFSGGQVKGKQKAVIHNSHIYVYYMANNNLAAYKTAETDGKTWTLVNVQGVNGANAADISSIVEYNKNLYMVANNQIYWSANGSDWSLHLLLNRNNLKFATLISAIQPDTESNNTKNAGISGIASADGGFTYHFCMTDENANMWRESAKPQEIPSGFPKRNISSAISFTKTGVPFIISMGTNIEREGDDEEEEEEPAPLPIVPWSSENGLSWVDLSTTSASYCPMLSFPSVIAYNEAIYAFGNEFKAFYHSPSGITWKEANKKFYFPKELTKRAGANYSVVIDKAQFIWIIFSKDATTGEGKDDVWRGRLNKLGFEKQ